MKLAKKLLLMGEKKRAAVPWYLAGGIDISKVVVAYQPKGAADLAASYINLVNPGTFDAVAPIAAPTFDGATGWIFDGISQFLSTTFTPAGTTEYSMLIRFSDYVDPGFGNQTVWCGYEAAVGSRRWYLESIPSKCAVLATNTPSVSGVSASSAFGVAGARIIGSLFWNGAFEASTVITTTAEAAWIKPIWIGAIQNDGDEASPKKWSNFRVQAFVLYGASSAITADQMAAVSAAMAAL